MAFPTLKAWAVATAAGAASLITTPAQAVEIEYWQYFFDARVAAMDQLIEKFEAANPDITVTMTHFPYADYRTKVAAAIPAGEGPDVVQLFYGWLNDYVGADLIQPLPGDAFPVEAIDAEFFPMVQAMKGDGQYWALPTAVRSLALFYNERLMEEAGVEPPTNLDELIAAAQAMTKVDGAGNITQVGLTAGMTAQDHHWWREVLVRQFGSEPYLDDYKTVNYDTEAGRKALDFYVGLATDENPVTAFNFMDEPQAAFKAGRAGMHIDGSFRIGALESTRGLKWGVTELPANADGMRSNYSSYWVNAITTKAEGEKYDAAVKFMQYITSDEAMQVWLDVVGELPAKPSVGMTETNANDPVFGPFIRGLEYAHTTKFADESGQRQAMVEMVERITLEGMDPGESLTIAAEAEQKILDDYYSGN
ncbi:extracellular solute-binding protein [Primorskyibacter flagellatus]|uniref:Carbohydrate ABC transporter substrate-binding protein, CUT1 family n=1 Tax=Primorskyibacter flagellatus TaxID=1387277 RepID=A0A1W2A5T0_9RHOB|nr:extracellular solute-binding protein [Primorskyibacter flagellatus]SMC55638.1 carbohydrate ABC transporter substrate-binding protein, CUT1 family [Primorskyibacter flagellatus]